MKYDELINLIEMSEHHHLQTRYQAHSIMGKVAGA
jgi:hypothetical protein